MNAVIVRKVNSADIHYSDSILNSVSGNQCRLKWGIDIFSDQHAVRISEIKTRLCQKQD